MAPSLKYSLFHHIILKTVRFKKVTDFYNTYLKQNCLSKMKDYGLGRLFEPKSKSMNDLVSDEATKVSGIDLKSRFSWLWFYFGLNNPDNANKFVFDSDNSPALSAFSPTWYNYHGPGSRTRSGKCGLLGEFYKRSGIWAYGDCKISRRSICE